MSLYWRLEIRLGILSLYSESLMKRLLSLSIPMASDVRFKAITSISENLGTTPGRGIFPFSFMRLSPNCLQILRILLNIKPEHLAFKILGEYGMLEDFDLICGATLD